MSDQSPEIKQYWESLTKREQEVLLLIAQFHTNAEISKALNISKKTAEHHASHILNKLNLSSRREAARWTAKHKFVDL